MSGVLKLVATCILAGASIITHAAPQVDEPAAAADVRARLARDDYRGASVALNALTVARLPAKLMNQPDPVLDRLYAEILSRTAEPRIMAGFARRAAISAPLRERSRYRLLLAIAQESGGDFKSAEDEYRSLAADPAIGPDATLGLARMQMLSDPRAAIATLEAMPAGRPDRAWEQQLLIARAAAMAGNEAKAKVAIEAAWSAAPLAAAGDAAVARLATDRAISAGRLGDRAALVALLSVDRLDRGTVDGSRAVGDAVPVCGPDGLRADDVVIVDVIRQPSTVRPRISVIWANRTAAAGPFLRAASRGDVATLADGQVATLALRCRTSPSPDYPAMQNIASGFTDWLAQQGVYAITPPDGENVATSLASMLAERETRYGPNSLFVVPPLLMVFATTAVEGYGSDEARKRSAAIAERIASILQQNGAPSDLLLMAQLQVVTTKLIAQTLTPEAAQKAFAEALEHAAAEPSFPLDPLYGLALAASSTPNAPAVSKETLLTKTLAVFRQRAGVNDPRTKALAIRLIWSKRANRDAGAMARLTKEYGLGADQCAVAEVAPSFVSSAILSEDYPFDLMTIMLRGQTTLEFAIDANGNARDGRILVSDPAFAFDTVASDKVSTIRYDPARRGGRPVACKGGAQNVRWQLPYG